MPYLIINRTFNLLLFICLPFLIACSSQPTKTAYQNTPEPETKTASNTPDKTNSLPIKSPNSSPIDLWHRLFSLYQLPSVDNKRVQAQINWYSKHPEYLARVQKNAEPYLHYIVSEVEKRNLPGELALLPIVESAFKPFAYSHGRAAGLWQFIPSTGQYFGLKQNWWYDGRRDVYASTQAALDYMSRLSKRFEGDWLLALAAYNAGGGTISSAIRKNKKQHKPSDFWSLSLRQETKDYVPKLLAIAYILSHSEQFQISLRPIPNQPYFDKVDINKQIDLVRAAQLADIKMEQFYELNPAFNQWATDPQGPHYLLLPVKNLAIFQQQLKSLPDNQRVQWKRHKIKKGETLSHIAKKYQTSPTLIEKSNQMTGNTIRAGKYLLIPTASFDSSLYSSSESARKNAIIKTNRKGKAVYYSVKKGDSFWRIANRHKVGVRQLAKWNAMAPGDTLKEGQQLTIWLQANLSQPLATSHSLRPQQKNQSIRYTVRNGDSLYLISQRFNVSVNDLKRWNILNKKYLKPGQSLKIIVDITRS